MTTSKCPDPGTCPVPEPNVVDLRRVRTVAIDAGTPFYTAFHRIHWPSLFNGSGRGDTRFAPLSDAEGKVVPTLYGARTRTVAVLETALHEVNPGGARVVSEQLDLAPRGLARISMPARSAFLDLRDEALAHLGLERRELVATLPSHYPCTRAWAHALRERERIGPARPVGLLWSSRMAELAQEDSELFDDLLEGQPSEVFVLFGDRVPTDAARYRPTEVYDDLAGAAARNLVEEIARQLRATIVGA